MYLLIVTDLIDNDHAYLYGGVYDFLVVLHGHRRYLSTQSLRMSLTWHVEFIVGIGRVLLRTRQAQSSRTDTGTHIYKSLNFNSTHLSRGLISQ